jgi:hypothetical protein
MVTIHAGGIALSVRKEVAPIFKGFCDELVKKGFPLAGVADDWGFACRVIRGTTSTPSNHSWGLAIDLNSTQNQMGSRKTTFPAWAIKLGKEKYALTWGGDYNTRPDPMHWEWTKTPGQAAWLVAALASLPPSQQPPEPVPQIISLEDDMPTVVAQDVQMNPSNPTQGYILDAKGGVHGIGGAVEPKDATYWKDAGPARRLVITDWAKPAGYVMDALGGMHAFGGAKTLTNAPYWKGGFVPPTPPV